MRKLLLVLLLLAAGAAASAGYVLRRWDERFPDSPRHVIVDIPRGLGTREVLDLLASRGVVADSRFALAYVLWSGRRGKLQAGEYLFDKPMTIPEVIAKLAGGDVYLHKWTVPEGLTSDEVAEKWQMDGFGDAAQFRRALQAQASQLQDLDPKADSLEGFLYPETYMFPRRVTAEQGVLALVARFRSVLRELQQQVPEKWPLPLRETVILASLVESEAQIDDERPLIASVFLNRLKKGMTLDCDPTVIYALEQAGLYKGRLLKADLQFDSDYNTYKRRGLPPGPISNPGIRSIRAAARPAETRYLYFVRMAGGRHDFSETLSEHNKAVARYRRLVTGRR